jgi:hypothetical protein
MVTRLAASTKPEPDDEAKKPAPAATKKPGPGAPPAASAPGGDKPGAGVGAKTRKVGYV